MTEPPGLFDPETPTQAAARFGRAKMAVFPVDMRPDQNGQPRKTPPYGYKWKQRATTVIKEVVEDFTDAEQDIGIDNVGIAWALGLDGYLAPDLDGAEPDWWPKLGQTAVNVTRRGRHLIFRQPQGRRIGNGTSRFPTQGWGEVRGAGGYIVIWWKDRPGFEVAQLRHVADFPHPEWLTDAGEDAEAVSFSELEKFKAEHVGGTLGPIKGYQTRLEGRAPGASRHDVAVEVACWMAREAAAGLVPAREAFAALEDWWKSVATAKARRPRLRECWTAECWAIGQLTDERIAEVRAKAGAEQAAWVAQQVAEQDDFARMVNAGSAPQIVAYQPGVNLPEEFWTARTLLAAIRAFAHSRQRSADGVYAVVRARFCALVPYTLRLDTGVAVPMSLNSMVAIVANSGGGKTTVADLGRELVDLSSRKDVYEVPPGSGEGMVEAFFEMKDDPSYTGKGKPPKVKTKTRDAVLLDLDEGQGLLDMATRNGATLLSTLRSAYSGGRLGQKNANAETTRILAPGSYRLVLLVGFQPEISARLLADAATGTPQRFVLFNAADPSIQPGSVNAIPVVPKPIAAITGVPHLMTLVPAVAKEVQEYDLAVQQSRRLLALLDSHRNQNRLKEAAVLALLDKRQVIDEEDWRLAGMIMDASDALRRWVGAIKVRGDQEVAVRRGQRDAVVESAKERQLVAAMSERLIAKVEQGPAGGTGRRELMRQLTSKGTRHRFETALDLAVANLQVEVDEGRVRRRQP